MKHTADNQRPTTQLEQVLPEKLHMDWPRMNDDTTCLCLCCDDSGEIMLRIEQPNEDEKKFENALATEICKRYSAFPEMKNLLDELDKYFNSKAWTAKGKMAKRMGEKITTVLSSLK